MSREFIITNLINQTPAVPVRFADPQAQGNERWRKVPIEPPSPDDSEFEAAVTTEIFCLSQILYSEKPSDGIEILYRSIKLSADKMLDQLFDAHGVKVLTMSHEAAYGKFELVRKDDFLFYYNWSTRITYRK